MEPEDWSPCGKYILTSFLGDGGSKLGLVTVEDRAVHYLKTIHGIDPHPLEAKFSPDGKYIVFEFPQDQSTRKTDISLISLDGEHEIPLIEHPADDRLLGWSPDGKSILFVSDRTGTRDAWIIQVSGRKAQGDPQLLRRDIGFIGPMGFTQDGSFYYSTSVFRYDIFHASINPKTGEIVDPPKKYPLPYEGHNQRLDLSPDGKSVFYIRETSQEFYQILIRDLETGKEKEFCRIPPYDNNTIALSPEGKRLALMMREGKDVRVLKVFQVTGGEPVELHRFHQKGRNILDIAWSPDGRYIYFERRGIEPENEDELWRIPSEGGDVQNLGLSMHGFMHLNVHPDGKRITFAARTMHEKAGAVWVMENFLPKLKDKK